MMSNGPLSASNTAARVLPQAVGPIRQTAGGSAVAGVVFKLDPALTENALLLLIEALSPTLAGL
jgi:hypothetical protein